MDVFVLGVGVHPPSAYIADKRLEEMVFETARAALDDARVRRADIDHVTLAGCDELDGRSISSMLLAAPAGAYLKDELRCTDSGLIGLALGALRVEAGLFGLGLVVSWSKTSLGPIEDVMRMRCEPFFTRPVGLNMAITDALFAGAVSERLGIGEEAINRCVVAAFDRAARNPRGLQSSVPVLETIAASPYVATPLRTGHRAPLTDGAAAIVLASKTWVEAHPDHRPLARITGLGWAVDNYQLSADRLGSLGSFRTALARALQQAQLAGPGELDVIELETPTGYHELAYRHALGAQNGAALCPSGGAFAQNPYFCTSLVNAVEAVFQVANRAGAVQVPGARRAAAHGCHGFAQQGNAIVIVEGA